MAEKKVTDLEKISIKLTEWIGTPQSLIVHTILFIGIFALIFFGIRIDEILLLLTTAVSLEAIYLALFIQMTVNRNTQSLEDVEEDIDEIQEDVEGFEGDFDEIQDNVEDLETNLAMMQRNVKELGEDVEEISGDIDQIQLEDQEEDTQEAKDRKTMKNIESSLLRLSQEMLEIKKNLSTVKKA